MDVEFFDRVGEDEKVLLCTFIYSAYSSGYCGLDLGIETKKEHMGLYLDYIKERKYFPEREIRETQAKMMEQINVESVRDYIYMGHRQVVQSRLEEGTKKPLKDLIKEAAFLFILYQCSVRFYEITHVGDDVMGKDLVLGQEKKLQIVDGLEKPNIGDIVSSHWNFMLERISEGRYLQNYRDYVHMLRKLV